MADDGTLEVPPLERAELTGWYRLGPTPGEIGNALIVGHVDSRRTGAAVFYRLSALRPGDGIAVTRADGSVARFTVERTERYPKSSFPADLVYGSNPKPSLRLVTCGGQFDRGTRSYLDNIIVSATLTSWASA
ncbi:class F sortase [Micromonospora sp. NPDC006766]|uniref:class F sortase n=1 Tax=Micromonospora sp. NPDC006766 TaxID=3154778 RepID=UPI0033DB96E6